MDRLSEIRVPTLVMSGRDDFVFPPEHQGQLAAGTIEVYEYNWLGSFNNYSGHRLSIRTMSYQSN